MIPEVNNNTVVLDHWQKFIEFGKVKGHNKAVADLVQKEMAL